MKTLENSLRLGMTMPVYIFCGAEALLMSEAVARLENLLAPGDNSWNKEILRGDEHDLDDALAACQSTSLLGEKKLVVIKDAWWLQPRRRKAGNSAEQPAADEAEDKAEDKAGDQAMTERLLAYLLDPNPGVVLVMTVNGALNRNSRLAKAVAQSGRIVDFPLLKGLEREQWLAAYFRRAGKQADRGVCAYISLMCGEGLLALQSEADKLILYCADKTLVSMEDAETMVSRSALASVFQMTDDVVRGQAAEAHALLQLLYRQGESPYALLAMLANQFRTALAAKSLLDRGCSAAAIADSLAINHYFAKKCAAQGRLLSYAKLFRALDILLAADIDAKTGQSEAHDALELAVFKICALR